MSDRAGTNDIYRLEVSDEASAQLPMPTPVIASPADERDLAVARDYVVFLSNGEGLMRTYRVYPPYDVASALGVTPGLQGEAHPAPLDDATADTLVYLSDANPRGIYVANYTGYVPFVVGEAFNGHPAAGPVPWLPDADWSYRQLQQFRPQGKAPRFGEPAGPT